VEWTSGIGDFKNPESFGTLVLVTGGGADADADADDGNEMWDEWDGAADAEVTEDGSADADAGSDGAADAPRDVPGVDEGDGTGCSCSVAQRSVGPGWLGALALALGLTVARRSRPPAGR
jgi:MYXO-CTERM domain-containing protein